MSAAGSFLRLLRTVRWLRGEQVCGQVRERLRGFLERRGAGARGGRRRGAAGGHRLAARAARAGRKGPLRRVLPGAELQRLGLGGGGPA